MAGPVTKPRGIGRTKFSIPRVGIALVLVALLAALITRTTTSHHYRFLRGTPICFAATESYFIGGFGAFYEELYQVPGTFKYVVTEATAELGIKPDYDRLLGKPRAHFEIGTLTYLSVWEGDAYGRKSSKGTVWVGILENREPDPLEKARSWLTTGSL